MSECVSRLKKIAPDQKEKNFDFLLGNWDGTEDVKKDVYLGSINVVTSSSSFIICLKQDNNSWSGYSEKPTYSC